MCDQNVQLFARASVDLIWSERFKCRNRLSDPRLKVSKGDNLIEARRRPGTGPQSFDPQTD
jgi:hypothetical protein